MFTYVIRRWLHLYVTLLGNGEINNNPGTCVQIVMDNNQAVITSYYVQKLNRLCEDPFLCFLRDAKFYACIVLK